MADAKVDFHGSISEGDVSGAAWILPLFKEAELESHAEKALAWVAETGCTLNDLRDDEEAIAEVLEYLKLRKYEAKRFRKVVCGGAVSSGHGTPSASSPDSTMGSRTLRVPEQAAVAAVNRKPKPAALTEAHMPSPSCLSNSRPPSSRATNRSISFEMPDQDGEPIVDTPPESETDMLDQDQFPQVHVFDPGSCAEHLPNASEDLKVKNTFFDLSSDADAAPTPGPATCPLPKHRGTAAPPAHGGAATTTSAAGQRGRKNSGANSGRNSRSGSDAAELLSALHEIGPTPDWFSHTGRKNSDASQRMLPSVSEAAQLVAQQSAQAQAAAAAALTPDWFAPTPTPGFRGNGWFSGFGHAMPTPGGYGPTPTPGFRHWQSVPEDISTFGPTPTPGMPVTHGDASRRGPPGVQPPAGTGGHFANLLAEAAADEPMPNAEYPPGAIPMGGCMLPPMPMGMPMQPPMPVTFTNCVPNFLCMDPGPAAMPHMDHMPSRQANTGVNSKVHVELARELGFGARAARADGTKPRRHRGSKLAKDPDRNFEHPSGWLPTGIVVELGDLARGPKPPEEEDEDMEDAQDPAAVSNGHESGSL